MLLLFTLKAVILQSRVLDLVLHQPSYSKHPRALLTYLVGISLHTDNNVDSPGFVLLGFGLLFLFFLSGIGFSILLYKMCIKDCHSSPKNLASPKQLRMASTTLCIISGLRLSVSLKETEDGIKTVRFHIHFRRHCIKLRVIPFLTESVSVLLSSRNCS